MIAKHFVYLLVLVSFVESLRIFPFRFKFGVATSSYQIEGGWNEDGKGENIWDHMCHTNPSFVHNQDNGDVACDSYHNWQEDIRNVKALGVDFYRFSLSWSRILPTGRTDVVNQAGIDYYKNLIRGLRANGIEPLVTLYHWDLPQPLQDIGGWLNPELETIFTDYARVAFEEFGDLVKSWITFNEPKQTCQGGYGEGSMAPGIKSSGQDEYVCTHILIKAHARAWRLYDDEFRSIQKGRISITIDGPWLEPLSNSTLDAEAAQRARQFIFGWYANPIFNRNYPQIMIDRIDRRSEEQLLPQSRLPKFTEAELDYISGTFDFFGLNVYTTALIYSAPERPLFPISFGGDVSVGYAQDPSWPSGSNPLFKVVPWGMRKLVNWIKEEYNNPEIIITENGFGDLGDLVDTDRINYHRSYLENLVDAIVIDGVKCTGYAAWSLMDNFEWASGYREKLGLFQVDFNSTDRRRKPKLSAQWYGALTRTHILL